MGSILSKSTSKDLLNSRVRIYHRTTQASVSGWIYDLNLPDLWIATDTALPLSGLYVITAQSEGQTVAFNARLVVEDQEETIHRKTPIFMDNGMALPQPTQFCYQLAAVSEVKRTPNQQAARKAASDFKGLIEFNGNVLRTAIWDISKQGVGILTSEPLDAGHPIALLCDLDGEEFRLEGEVRHSRQVHAPKPLYLSGIQFGEVGRIVAARWRKRMDDLYQEPSRCRRSTEVSESANEIIHLSEVVEDTFTQNLAEHASDLLERLRRVSQTERRLLKQHLVKSALTGPEATDEAMATMSIKIELLRRLELDLEASLFKTLGALKSLTHDQVSDTRRTA